MSPEKQRVAIAEACGWKLKPSRLNGGWSLYTPEGSLFTSFWHNDKMPSLSDPGVIRDLPDYLADLNAMSEAPALALPKDKMSEYHGHLYRICGGFSNTVEATAAQRAEAFLRVTGKWKDGK